jgi:perosamine synthetase
MAFIASLALRFEFNFIGYFFGGIWPLIIIGMILRPSVLFFAGVYKQVWRYATTRDFFRLGVAIVIGSILISIAALLMYPRFIYTLPRSVLVIEGVLSLILLGGFRLFIHQIERYSGDLLWKRVKLGPASKVLIVGAGNAGVSIIRELTGNPQLGLKPIALIDDDSRKIGRKIHGINVYGPIINLPEIAKQQNIDAVIIAIPSAPQQTIQNIKNMCHSLQLPYSTMPPLSSFLRNDDEAPSNELMKLPMSLPDITSEEIEAVVRVMQSRNLSIGSQTMAFEKFAAAQASASQAVAVINGTAALHLSMIATGIQPGDEVITSPFSFIATANCILYQNAKPVFVDVDPISLNIDPSKIEKAITPKTKAIIAVHIFGQPADMDPIMQTAAKHNLVVIEDACEAIGAEYKNRRVGAIGQAGAFAFYPNKQMTTGEGAVLVTNDEQWAELFRSLRNQGRDQYDGWLNHTRLGYNYRISEMNAAIGVVQMRRLDYLLSKRQDVADEYQKNLKSIKGVSPLSIINTTTRMSWFVYPVQFESGLDRNQILDKLSKQGIPTRPYFSPIHLQPFYREKFGYKEGDFPNAEFAGKTILALPFYSAMKKEETVVVCDALNEIVNLLSK